MEPILHPKTVKRLEGIVKRPHGSYLFHGQPGLGKQMTVKNLAKQLNCAAGGCLTCPTCLQIEANGFPGLLIVKPDRSIGIDQVHELIRELSLKGFYGDGFRVVLIDDAHTLTREAQNSLLRMLEEPPDKTITVLVTERPSELIPTVRSRLIAVGFLPPNRKQLVDELTSKYDLTIQRSNELIAIGGTNIGLIVRLGQDEALRQTYLEASKLSERVLNGDLFERLKLAAELSKMEGVLLAFEQIMIRSFRLQLRQKAAKQQAVSALASLERYLTRRAANVSPKSALEVLMVELV